MSTCVQSVRTLATLRPLRGARSARGVDCETAGEVLQQTLLRHNGLVVQLLGDRSKGLWPICSTYRIYRRGAGAMELREEVECGGISGGGCGAQERGGDVSASPCTHSVGCAAPQSDCGKSTSGPLKDESSKAIVTRVALRAQVAPIFASLASQ